MHVTDVGERVKICLLEIRQQSISHGRVMHGEPCGTDTPVPQVKNGVDDLLLGCSTTWHHAASSFTWSSTALNVEFIRHMALACRLRCWISRTNVDHVVITTTYSVAHWRWCSVFDSCRFNNLLLSFFLSFCPISDFFSDCSCALIILDNTAVLLVHYQLLERFLYYFSIVLFSACNIPQFFCNFYVFILCVMFWHWDQI